MAIIQRNYFSDVYLWSARNQARIAADIEKEYSSPSKESLRTAELELQHQAYVITAVTNSVAFMECVVNEVLQDVTDDYKDHIGSLSKATKLRLTGYWVAGGRASILDKYGQALWLARRKVIDRGVDPVQSAALVVALRNYFVHYKPENVGTRLDPPKLAKKLRGRFADNELMTGDRRPWFPDHAIGAGCAIWAHETAFAFVDHWASLMRLTSLPYQTAELN